MVSVDVKDHVYLHVISVFDWALKANYYYYYFIIFNFFQILFSHKKHWSACSVCVQWLRRCDGGEGRRYSVHSYLPQSRPGPHQGKS